MNLDAMSRPQVEREFSLDDEWLSCVQSAQYEALRKRPDKSKFASDLLKNWDEVMERLAKPHGRHED